MINSLSTRSTCLTGSGTEPVTWRSPDGARRAATASRASCAARPVDEQPLDLLAVDAAYPTVVCTDAERHAAHQAWQFGEVILLDVDGRVAAAVPDAAVRRQPRLRGDAAGRAGQSAPTRPSFTRVAVVVSA